MVKLAATAKVIISLFSVGTMLARVIQIEMRWSNQPVFVQEKAANLEKKMRGSFRAGDLIRTKQDLYLVAGYKSGDAFVTVRSCAACNTWPTRIRSLAREDAAVFFQGQDSRAYNAALSEFKKNQ